MLIDKDLLVDCIIDLRQGGLGVAGRLLISSLVAALRNLNCKAREERTLYGLKLDFGLRRLLVVELLQ